MDQIKIKNYQGHILVIISTFGFGIVPVLAKYVFDKQMNAETILTYRFLIAGSFFLVYSLYKKIKLYKDLSTSLKLLLVGVLYALESTCFFAAFKHISPSIGQLIFQINPLIVALGSFLLFKEKITRNTVVALIFTIVGCSLLFWKSSSFVTPFGIFLVLSATTAYSIYVLLGKKMLNDVEPMVVTTYITIGCGVFLLIYSLIGGKMLPINGMDIVGVIIVLSLFSTVISILTFIMGLKILGATTATIISALEPVITVVLAYIFFDDILNILQIFGMILIISSIVVINLKTKEEISEKNDYKSKVQL